MEAVLIALLGFIASILSALINGYFTIKAAQIKQNVDIKNVVDVQGKNDSEQAKNTNSKVDLPKAELPKVDLPKVKEYKTEKKQYGFLALIKAIALNFVFGFGLFSLDGSSKRKWVYPASVLGGFISYIIAGMAPAQYHGYGWDIYSVMFSFGAWGVSFLDIIFTWAMKKVYKL